MPSADPVPPSEPGQPAGRSDERADGPAWIDPTAVVSPRCVVEDGARVGAGAVLHPHVVIGAGARVGAGTTLSAGVVVAPGVVIGERCLLHPGVVLGFRYRPERRTVPTAPADPHRLVVEDDVEIGPNTVVESGQRETTWIGCGAVLGGQVFLGHDCVIGAGAHLVSMVGLAGGVAVGEQALLCGQVGVTGNARIGDRAVVFAHSGVTGNVPDDGRYLGFPARPRQSWLRAQALPRLVERLQRRIEALEQAGRDGESADTHT